MSSGKLIIFSAPSGCGKSTILNQVLKLNSDLHFSVSATSRPPRPGEKDGENYYFITPEQFKEKIANGEFLEYEELFQNKFYGTLKSEVEKCLGRGENIVLDVDVNGAVNIKRLYGDMALALFILPPSLEVLRERLVKRGTETLEVIDERVSRAEYELSRAPEFDKTILNDDLDTAVNEANEIVMEFINA